MGYAKRKWAGGSEGQGPGYQLEDYILARMDLKGLSVRALAAMSGIGRNRLHAGLHREADKRIPLRMPETQAILDALGIHPIEALLAINIFESVHASWFAVLDGQGERPGDHNPLVEVVGRDNNLHQLAALRAEIAKTATAMPPLP